MGDGSFYLCEKDRENIKQAGDLMRKIDEKLKEIEKEEDAKK
jgi:protein subunit release factor B